MPRKLPRAALCLTVVCWGFLAAGEAAFAQQYGRARAPRQYRGVSKEPYVSPYLNLVRPGGEAGFNYFTLVQPQTQQMQFNQQQVRNVQGLNQQFQQQQAELMSPYGPVGGIRPTGYSGVGFMNYSHYYPGFGGGASAGGRTYSSSSGGGMGMGGMGMGMGGMGFY